MSHLGKITKVNKETVQYIIDLLNEKLNTDRFKLIEDEYSFGNPFDTTTSFNISEVDGVITVLDIAFIPHIGGYSIRIGELGNWVGGLEYNACWFGGFTKTLSIAAIQECFDTYWEVYDIFKTYGCGLEYVTTLSKAEFEQYAKDNGYTVEVSKWCHQTHKTIHIEYNFFRVAKTVSFVSHVKATKSWDNNNLHVRVFNANQHKEFYNHSK